eukprot:3941951-Rhodomonas_salina.4
MKPTSCGTAVRGPADRTSGCQWVQMDSYASVLHGGAAGAPGAQGEVGGARVVENSAVVQDQLDEEHRTLPASYQRRGRGRDVNLRPTPPPRRLGSTRRSEPLNKPLRNRESS